MFEAIIGGHAEVLGKQQVADFPAGSGCICPNVIIEWRADDGDAGIEHRAFVRLLVERGVEDRRQQLVDARGRHVELKAGFDGLADDVAT